MLTAMSTCRVLGEDSFAIACSLRRSLLGTAFYRSGFATYPLTFVSLNRPILGETAAQKMDVLNSARTVEGRRRTGPATRRYRRDTEENHQFICNIRGKLQQRYRRYMSFSGDKAGEIVEYEQGAGPHQVGGSTICWWGRKKLQRYSQAIS